MFPILFRVLTIAGSCALAALLTRQYLRRKQEKEGPESLPDSETEQERSKKADEIKESASRLKDRQEARSESLQTSQSNLEQARSRATRAQESVAESRDYLKTRAEDLKKMAEERSQKVARSKQAALAAREAVTAIRNEQGGKESKLEMVQKAKEEMAARSGRLKAEPETPEEEAATPEKKAAPAAASGQASDKTSAQAQDFSVPEDNQARQRAKLVLDSSAKVLNAFKAPAGLTVDLDLARESLSVSGKLLDSGQFESSWELASAVGLLLGIAEIRAGVEDKLKALKSDASKAEVVNELETLLKSADDYLAQTRQLLEQADSLEDGEFSKLVQSAFQKTTLAQTALMKAQF